MATAPPHDPFERPEVDAPDLLPDTRLFWQWVWKALRPYTGWVVAAFGLLFIIVGYLGVSREALVAKQLPYLISGAAYVAVEQIRRDSGRIARLERMVHELHTILLTRVDAPDAEVSGFAPPDARYNSGQNGSGQLVALPVGHSFHRPDCSMVQGKDNVQGVTARTVRARGLQPCRLCEPDLAEIAPSQ
jgi:hypothetical protein